MSTTARATASASARRATPARARGATRTRAVRRRAIARRATGDGTTRADADADADADAAAAARASKKWKPKPLPSTFGDAASPRARSPFDAKTGATSPFEKAPGTSASPFEKATSDGTGKPASPFGAVATPVTEGGAASGDATTTRAKAAASPFGAAEARSPFAAAPGAAKSPFGGASAAKNPFNEPEAALYGAKPVAKKPAVKVEEKTSFLESLPRPTLGQFFIVFSFVTIISLMLGTFWVVVNAGGVHFNDS